jgi:hypothetical protein
VQGLASRPVVRFLVIPKFVSQVPGRQLYPLQPEFRLANISELFRTRVHYRDQPFAARVFSRGSPGTVAQWTGRPIRES